MYKSAYGYALPQHETCPQRFNRTKKPLFQPKVPVHFGGFDQAKVKADNMMREKGVLGIAVARASS